MDTTTSGYSGAGRLFAAMADRAATAGRAPAVSAPDGEYDYAGLRERTTLLADRLAADGAGPGTPVGLCFGRSRDMVAALLAVWSIGATAVLMDPAYPAERLEAIRADAEVRILLSARAGAGPAGGPLGQRSAARGNGRIERPDQCAYIVYTSGTTGRPKGVEVTYRGLDTFLAAVAELKLSNGGTGVNAVSPAFDGWLWCTLLYLLHGKCVAIVDPTDGLDDALETLQPDTVCLTPSLLATVRGALPSAEVLVVAGEACPPALAARWRPGRRMLNVYGPTEATIAATWADTAAGDDPATIGRPLPGYRALVLDPAMHPTPAGEVGELFVAGAALARGYRGLPGLTAARFAPDPFAADGSRMYRTGDLVRVAGAHLEYVGRVDDQLKVRGYRVEPAEVERTALAVDGVLQAACFVADTSVLALAVVADHDHASDGAAVVAAVRERCARVLPDFLRPAFVALVETLPTTPTGKTDRAALARDLTGDRGSLRPPTSERERRVHAEFERQLEREVTDVTENFFDLGGHSLLAANTVAALRETTGLPLKVRHLLADPTVAGLAAQLDRLAAARSAAQPDA